MDDLAALPEVGGPEVLEALMTRCRRHQYFTYVGDVLLAFNPGPQFKEDDSQLGVWFRDAPPLADMPPHVLGLAHRAHRMLLNDVTSQAILVTGPAGSGKTKASRRLLSQLLREARLSPRTGLGPNVIMAQHVLSMLTTAATPANPESTRALKMAALHFRPDGTMHSAELRAPCLEAGFLTQLQPGCLPFAVFVAMMVSLSPHQRQLYHLGDAYRLLRNRGVAELASEEEERDRHLRHWDFLLDALAHLGVDIQMRNYAGQDISAFVAVLAAILHLSNLKFTTDPQSGRQVLANPHEIDAASELLCLRPEDLEGELVTKTTYVRGQLVRTDRPREESNNAKDALLVCLYHRLLDTTTKAVNAALSPQHSAPDNLTSITILESTSLEDASSAPARLETFCRNMAAERFVHHVHDVIFTRDMDACERERVSPYKIKYSGNHDVVAAVFGPEAGIMARLEVMTSDPRGSPVALVAALEADKALKKNPSFVTPDKKTRDNDTFSIKHSSDKKVTYSASEFLYTNRAALPETLHNLLATSGNPFVGDRGDRGQFPSNLSATESFQRELQNLLVVLDESNLHYVRCVQPCAGVASPGPDPAEVTRQLKEACVVEVARQRKFGFSACLPHQVFVNRFRDLALAWNQEAKDQKDLHKASRMILAKTELINKGVEVTRESVFLRYWHLHRLHALKAHRKRCVVTAQAHVRGFLLRKRMGVFPGSRRHRDAMHHMHNGSNGHGNGWRGEQREERNGREDQYSRHISQDGYHPHDNRLPRSSYGSRDSNTSHDAHGYPRNSDDVSLPGYVGHVTPTPPLSPSPSPSLTSTDVFYQQVTGRVLTSLKDLDPSVWAKLIYVERGRQVAKVYAEEQSIMVDGSGVDFDGERFGLRNWPNPDLDSEAEHCRENIREGVRLKREQDGSICACRLSEQPISVTGLGDPDGPGALAEDVVLCGGKLPYEKTVKVLDMKEFRSKAALDMKQGRYSLQRMRRACVTGLAFGRQDPDMLRTPSWLCIVNVKALAALEADEITREAEHQTARMEMTSPEDQLARLVVDDVKSRHGRGRWARTDQREHLQEKEKGDRHIRLQLRSKGLPVGEHVRYSWQHDKGSNNTTMEALQDMVDQRSPRTPTGGVRPWAKVGVAVKDQRRRSNFSRSGSSLDGGDAY